MNRTDIETEVAKHCTDRAEAARTVRKTFEILAQALKNGEQVTVSGFGSFLPRVNNARRRRHPATGEILAVPPKKTVRFRASPKLLE
ncbi:MAG: HU family DNA-binding protein [Elusimicrobiaceae bacterium]|nr:HU family DNA-binding protein [Elusimicrobiaceae bacterium]